MRYEYRPITPEDAREMLEHVFINRPKREDQVVAYARDMVNNNWRPVGDPIRVDTNGDLIDGQHRLSAIVASGRTVSMMVVSGVNPEDQIVIDSGVKRRAADYLTLDGRKYGARLASAARLLYATEAGRAYENRLRVTNSEIFGVIDAHPTLIDSVLAVEGINRTSGITPLNAALVHYIGSEKIFHTTWNFFDGVRTGVGLAATDPRLLLRNRLLVVHEAPARMAQLWLVLRALVLFKDDVQGYTKIQLPPGSKVSPEAIMEQVKKIRSYADEREVD